MAGIITLKAGKERSLLRRHPWIYDSAIQHIKGTPNLGDTVKINGSDGTFLAWGAYSPHSTLRVRLWSFNETDNIDEAWFTHHINRAIQRRASLYATTGAVRLIFGEGDGLPGLIADHYVNIDRHVNVVVIQCLSAGIAKWRDVIAHALQEATQAQAIVERSDAQVRTKEGLPSIVQVLLGTLPDTVIATEHGIDYYIDVLNGHKTGFYIDQRESRHLVYNLVHQRVQERFNQNNLQATGDIHKPLKILNCFSYTGGFSLAALKAGINYPNSVTCMSVDSSQDALNIAHNNILLNKLDPLCHTTRCEKVAEVLKSLYATGEQFDVIVLDPPKFAPSIQHLDKATRAYKDVNLRGMKLLAEGGDILTFSCSGAMSIDLFQKVVAGAVCDSRLDLAMMGRLGAGIDHPMRMTHPEGEYLKGLWLRKQ